jgi:hypothetical protein
MRENEICGTCRFWCPAWRFRKPLRGAEETPIDLPTQAPLVDSLKKHSQRGQCRRYAPRASALTTVWMETRYTDWCGDYDSLQGARPDEPAFAEEDQPAGNEA